MVKKKIVLVGGGGHSKVVIAQLRMLNEFEIIGIVDKEDLIGSEKSGIRFIGTDIDLKDVYRKGTRYTLITVGSTCDNIKRQELYDMAKAIGFKFPVITSPMAIVDKTVRIHEGTIIMPGCVVNVDSIIGRNCIINTSAIVEHDCRIKDHCHIAPGVHVSGGVEIGDMSFIGIGSSILQGIKIGRNVTVGAGCVVTGDIPDHSIVVGIPGRIIKNKIYGGFS